MPRGRSRYSVSTASGNSRGARSCHTIGSSLVANGQPIAAGDRDARPPGPAGSASGRRDSTKPREAKCDRRDRGRRRLGFRLAGERIGARRDQIADARRRGVVVAPVDRHEQRAALLAVADHDLEDAGAVRGRDAREAAVGEPVRLRRRRMHLDERLRQMRAEPRAHARCASWCATGRGRGRC